jgi:hypothetical protein
LAVASLFLPPPGLVHLQVCQITLFLWKLPGIPDPSNQHTVGVQPPHDLGQLVFSVILLFLFGLAVSLVSVGFGR